MKAPSKNWQEMVAPDEESRFTRYAAQLTKIQKEKNKEFGQGRTLHRKQLLGLEAQLEVLPQLPAHAAHGLFARPGVHPALVRISNGNPTIQKDALPDIRGFAIKVLGLQGPGALGGMTEAQDFVLINREVFGFKDSDAFVKLVVAAVQGGFTLIKHFFKDYGFFEGLGQLASAVKNSRRPFTGFATEPFFSAVPLACGPYAVRVRLLPPGGQGLNPAAAKDWAQDLKERLAQGPLRYTLQLQFFVAEPLTPIEDGRKNWDEKDAPFITVAYLTLEAPRPANADALWKRADEARFDPWCALVEHRPLGDVMRARKFAYFASQKNRN